MVVLAHPRKLTIGMCCIQDYKGAYFTIQSILLHHPEVLNEIEFVVIDNDPETKEGKALAKFCNNWVKKVPIRYIQFDEYKATSLRNKIFDNARTEYVMCCDSHVLFAPGAIRKLIDAFDNGIDEGGIIQGPLLMDDLNNACTHFSSEWEDSMLGQWKTDSRWKTEDYFEIPAQGLGVFACRKDHWLRFCDNNRGFGGEEVCIHEFYKQNGKKTICLSALQWAHLFRYEGEEIPYPNTYENRVKNYLREFARLNKDSEEIFEHFKSLITREEFDQWKTELG